MILRRGTFDDDAFEDEGFLFHTRDSWYIPASGVITSAKIKYVIKMPRAMEERDSIIVW